MRRPSPEVTAVAMAVLLGFLCTAGVWVSPFQLTVDTHFTDGHLAGATLAELGFWNGDLWRLHTRHAGGDDGVMFRPLLWPVMLLAGVLGPVLSLNLSWGLIPALNALGGIGLGRALGWSRQGGACLGLLLSWNMWTRVTLANGQLEQAILGLIALIWAGAIWAEQGKLWRVLVAPTSLLLTGLAAPNAGLSAALGLGGLALLRVVRARNRVLRHGLVLILSLVAALLIHHYHAPNYADVPNFFQPRLHPPAHHDPARFGIPSGWFANVTQQLDRADLRALLIPAGPAAYTESPVQHVPFLGWTVLFTATSSVLMRPRKTWMWWLVGLWMAMLSMGTETRIAGQRLLMPYALLEQLAPSAAASGSAYRLSMAAIVAFSAAAIAGVHASRAARPLLVLVVVFAWLETTQLPGRPLPFDTRPVLHHPELVALSSGTGAVLDLPLPLHGSCDALTAHYFNASTAHHRPLLHTLAAGPNYHDNTAAIQELHQLLKRPSCSDRIRAMLADLHAETVVLHSEPPCLPDPAIATCLTEGLGAPQDGEGVQWWSL